MGNMKANRKFIEGEEAVSAVIGVILMVAITVAIAATVYVYVSGMLGSPTTKTPNITFIPHPEDDTFEVNSADPGISWGDIKIKADKSEVWLKYGSTENATAVTTTSTPMYAASSAIFTSALTGEVTAGDEFEIIGPSSLDGDVEFTFMYEPTNTVITTVTVNV